MKLNTGLFHLLTTLWWLYWGLGQATGIWKDICAGRKALVECFGSNQLLLIRAILYGKRPNCEKGEDYCLGAVDTDYANRIKGKCSGHQQCEFLVGTGTIIPDKGSCPGAAQTTESNYLTVRYECVSDTTLIDICSVTTTASREVNFVSPGFPSQINTTSRPSECSCILNTVAFKSFYLYAYIYYTPDDCNIGEQLLTISNKDRAEEYSYPCSQLTDTTTKYLTKTKNIHIKFTSSINSGRFWFLIRDASSGESKWETIHISCNSHVTTPPLKTATRIDPAFGTPTDGTTGQLLTKYPGPTSESTSSKLEHSRHALSHELPGGDQTGCTVAKISAITLSAIIVILGVALTIVLVRRSTTTKVKKRQAKSDAKTNEAGTGEHSEARDRSLLTVGDASREVLADSNNETAAERSSNFDAPRMVETVFYENRREDSYEVPWTAGRREEREYIKLHPTNRSGKASLYEDVS